MKKVILIIFGLLATMAEARHFDLDKFGRTLQDVRRTVDQVEQTVRPIANAPAQFGSGSSYVVESPTRPSVERVRYSSGSSGVRNYDRKREFEASMGPKARFMAAKIDAFAENVFNPAKVWLTGLEQYQMILLLSFLILVAIVPIIVFSVSSNAIPGAMTVRKCVSALAAFAGVAFTAWGGFEIGGDFGEYLAIGIMASLGLSTAIAVLGGPFCGKGLFARLFAPVVLLELEILVFVLAVLLTVVFIVIVAIWIAISVFMAMNDDNTIYKCPECGRLFKYKPSSCPCGARFS